MIFEILIERTDPTDPNRTAKSIAIPFSIKMLYSVALYWTHDWIIDTKLFWTGIDRWLVKDALVDETECIHAVTIRTYRTE